jgi:hypothetical protein
MGGEGVLQSVTACMLGDACLVLGLVEGPLEISFMQMVSPAISPGTPNAALQAVAPLGRPAWAPVV